MSDNVVNPTIELARTKYADNVAVQAVVQCVETARSMADATLAVPPVDMLAAYRRGMLGEDGFSSMHAIETFSVTQEMKRIDALRVFAESFTILVCVLQAMGEDIEW